MGEDNGLINEEHRRLEIEEEANQDFESFERGRRSWNAYEGILSFGIWIWLTLQHRWLFHRTGSILVITLVCCTALALTGALEASSKEYYRYHHHDVSIKHDWTTLTSDYDFVLGKIDHWCLKGDDDNCVSCDDPLLPTGRNQYASWAKAYQINLKTIEHFLNDAEHSTGTNLASTSQHHSDEDPDLLEQKWYEGEQYYVDDFGFLIDNPQLSQQRRVDVVFLGDSMTEARTGRSMGRKSPRLASVQQVFQSQFSVNATVSGLALGIAGDTSPNLLWRILHGEMPEELNPPIWWVHIGINDLYATQCSEEVTLLGILRVVEEIQKQKPDSVIVLNSLLPILPKVSNVTSVFDYWPSIVEVNRHLEIFAANQDGVMFFDATDLFVETRKNEVVIKREYYMDPVHPNAAGYEIWGKKQKKMIMEILKIDSAD